MTTNLVDQPAEAGAGDAAADAGSGPAGSGPAGTLGTGTEAAEAAAEIRAIRQRIDEIDRTLIDLWQERARLSQQVGRTRLSSGGTRLVLSREQEILERFRAELGVDGTQLALLLLRAGRGPL